MKVTVDWALCDANGVCAIEAPSFFELSDDDELLQLKEEVGLDDLEQVRSAVRVCPKHALSTTAAGSAS